jgi:hypothetical protein
MRKPSFLKTIDLDKMSGKWNTNLDDMKKVG